MMDQTRVIARVVRGATAGLVAGVVASFAMDRFQAVLSFMSSPSDDHSESATSRAADTIALAVTGDAIPDADKSLAGQLIHYLLGTGLGITYGVAAEFKPAVTAGFGSAFGVGVAGVLDDIAVPAVGLGTAPWNTGIRVQAYGMVSHLVFGAVAEFTRRQVSSSLRSSS